MRPESKGHLSIGADADISILDFANEKAFATIVGGKVIMLNGELLGSGTTIICDERGAQTLKKRDIRYIVKEPFSLNQITDRYVP